MERKAVGLPEEGRAALAAILFCSLETPAYDLDDDMRRA